MGRENLEFEVELRSQLLPCGGIPRAVTLCGEKVLLGNNYEPKGRPFDPDGRELEH